MQALYLLGARQVSSLTQEIARFEALGSNGPTLTSDPSQEARAANGQLVASLASFSRTIDDYKDMARKELIQDKREKAETRVKKFRQDYSKLKQSFDQAKKAQQMQQATSDRSELLGEASGTSSSTAGYGSPSASRLRGRGVQPPTVMPPAESPFTIAPSARSHANKASVAWGAPGGGTRTNAALDESNFLGNTGNMLDQYIAQGQAILGNLHTQRDIVKGTQKRLLSVANTLGLSRETITFIERRGKGDGIVMGIGIIGTLVAFWLIIRYFG